MLKIDGKPSDKRAIIKEKGWQPYRQSIIVFAKKITEECEVTTMSGKIQHGAEGDYLIIGQSGNKWVLKKDIFFKMYEPL